MEDDKKIEEQMTELPEVQPAEVNWLAEVDLSSITRRVADGSYVVLKNGLPYHVPNSEEFAGFFSQLDEYARAHPEAVTEEHPHVPTEEELAAQALAQAKAERAEAVAAITVEVDGMVFDGDENAMRRMSNALTAAQSADVDNWRTVTVPWVLADNTVVTVTMEQLARALRGAMEAMAKLWVLPYKS